jgi:SAM-dependent methyltransferase
MNLIENERLLYGGDYFKSRVDQRRLIAYRQDAEKIITRLQNTKSILDIGCGTGEFGEYFDALYYGYDPFTREAPLPDGYFDVVVFRGTLQHIYNPIEMLDYAQMHLNANGLLAILATPDTDSIGYARWGTLPALDAPRNWMPFGHRTLVNVLNRLGLKQIEVLHPYGKPYSNPLKNIFNFIIGKPDAFPGNMMECFARKHDP